MENKDFSMKKKTKQFEKWKATWKADDDKECDTIFLRTKMIFYLQHDMIYLQERTDDLTG